MNLWIRKRIFVVLGAALVASLLLPSPASATFPGANGKVAFLSGDDGFLDIRVVNADGSGRTLLSKDSANEFGPVWSPDGRKIAYQSDGDGFDNAFYIYTINAGGTAMTRLTDGPSDFTPRWSPDGTKIGFTSADLPRGTYVMNADGSELRLVASLDGPPIWSPDGTKVAFSEGEIYVAYADGSGLTQLTDTPDGFTGGLAWSPDSTKIVFDRRSRRESLDTDIYVMDADGTGQSIIAGSSSPDQLMVADWSPAERIVFNDNSSRIYTMNGDGSGASRVATGSGPKWSPDGTKILFQACCNRISVANADGTEVVNIATGYSPDWQPLRPQDFGSLKEFCKTLWEAMGKKAFRERYGKRGSALRNCIRQAGA